MMYFVKGKNALFVVFFAPFEGKVDDIRAYPLERTDCDSFSSEGFKVFMSYKNKDTLIACDLEVVDVEK